MDDINTKEGKREFINSMLDSLKEGLINKVDKMPDEWDGRELRWLISDYVPEQVTMNFDKKTGRYRSYKNTCYNKSI